MKIIKAHELEAGDCFRLTGDACNPEEQADNSVYEVLEIKKNSFSIPDMEKAGVDYKTASNALREGTWTGPIKSFPGNTFVLAKTENGDAKEMVIAPWVPLIKLKRD